MSALAFPTGAVHLCTTPKAGATTLALQFSRDVLANQGRVIWASCRHPNPERMRAVLGEIGPANSARFHALVGVTDLCRAIERVQKLAVSFTTIGLIVNDGWNDGESVTISERLSRITSLVSNAAPGSAVLMTSLAYEDASGGERSGPIEGLCARSGSALEEAGMETWWLVKDPNKSGRRILHRNGTSYELRIDKRGFIP